MAAKPGCTSKTTWEVCKADFLAQTTETDSAELEKGPGNSSKSFLRDSAGLTTWETIDQRDDIRIFGGQMRSGEILFLGKGFLSISKYLLILCPAKWMMGKSYRRKRHKT